MMVEAILHADLYGVNRPWVCIRFSPACESLPHLESSAGDLDLSPLMSVLLSHLVFWSSDLDSQAWPNITVPVCQFEEIGSDRSTFLGLRIYEARLKRGAREHRHCARLEITYLRRFSVRQIIRASDKMLARQLGSRLDRLADSYARLNNYLNDVKRGDRFTMDHCTQSGLTLFFNGELKVRLPDHEFARAYLAIWLHPSKPIDKNLRKNLLGNEPWPFASTAEPTR